MPSPKTPSRAGQAPIDLSKLSPDAYLRIHDLVPAILPIGRSTFWRWVQQGRWPKPVQLSAGVTAWRVKDVREALAKHNAAAVV